MMVNLLFMMKMERDSWEVIIVLPGVEVVPALTFYDCRNIKTVIVYDTVQRIENEAFKECWNLEFVKLSRSLAYIGGWAFQCCFSLNSIFIPPTCREIGDYAFASCRKLLLLGLPHHTQLDEGVFQNTALIKKSPIQINKYGSYNKYSDDEAIATQWVKSINSDESFALHHACSSIKPLADVIHALVKRQGIESMRMKNTIGITPSQYLEANTFVDISEKEIINRFTLAAMGEV